MTKKNNKMVYIVAFVLLLGGLVYLIASGISQGQTPTLQVGQALDMEAGELMKVRIYGKVDPVGIEFHEDRLGVNFIVADQVDPALTMPVAFRGAVPDTFTAGVEVILKGSYDKAKKVFNVTLLTTKCPSKYEEQRDDS